MWPAVMAGLALWKGASDKKKQNQDQQNQIADAFVSGYTGRDPNRMQITDADPVGTLAQGALSGVALQQSMDDAAVTGRLKNSEIAANNAYANKYAPSGSAAHASAQGAELSRPKMAEEDPDTFMGPPRPFNSAPAPGMVGPPKPPSVYSGTRDWSSTAAAHSGKVAYPSEELSIWDQLFGRRKGK